MSAPVRLTEPLRPHSDPSHRRVLFGTLSGAVGSVRGVGDPGRHPFRPCQTLRRKVYVFKVVQTRFYFLFPLTNSVFSIQCSVLLPLVIQITS